MSYSTLHPRLIRTICAFNEVIPEIKHIYGMKHGQTIAMCVIHIPAETVPGIELIIMPDSTIKRVLVMVDYTLDSIGPIIDCIKPHVAKLSIIGVDETNKIIQTYPDMRFEIVTPFVEQALYIKKARRNIIVTGNDNVLHHTGIVAQCTSIHYTGISVTSGIFMRYDDNIHDMTELRDVAINKSEAMKFVISSLEKRIKQGMNPIQVLYIYGPLPVVTMEIAKYVINVPNDVLYVWGGHYYIKNKSTR